jgi:NAD(P)H-dependent FMN reductase
LEKKSVAIFSVTGGPSGGARSQHDLRKKLVFFIAFVMIKPEVFIGSNYLKFHLQANLNNEALKKSLEA